MMPAVPSIQVLIPTYRRPNSAIAAIQSVLDAGRSDVRAFCQSNGFEPEIAAFAERHPEVEYRYFDENRGAITNFRELIRRSAADYVLFMSDEDRLCGEHISGLQQLLCEHKPPFAFCSVIEEDGKPYFPVKALGADVLTARQLALLFPIDPTYVSGYCYRRDAIPEALLDSCFAEDPANAYPHVLLRNALIAEGDAVLEATPIILKGREAQTGGDSHAHVADAAANGAAKSHLNPRMYGMRARAAQFYFLSRRLMAPFAGLGWPAKLFIRLYFLASWARITLGANDVSGEAFRFTSVQAARQDLSLGERQLDSVEQIYLWVVSVRPRPLALLVTQLLWLAVAMVKAIIFLVEFGPRRTRDFLAARRA